MTALISGILLRDKEVAEILRVSRMQIWRLSRAGKLTPIKLSARTTRFRSDDIIKFVEQAQETE